MINDVNDSVIFKSPGAIENQIKFNVARPFIEKAVLSKDIYIIFDLLYKIIVDNIVLTTMEIVLINSTYNDLKEEVEKNKSSLTKKIIDLNIIDFDIGVLFNVKYWDVIWEAFDAEVVMNEQGIWSLYKKGTKDPYEFKNYQYIESRWNKNVDKI